MSGQVVGFARSSVPQEGTFSLSMPGAPRQGGGLRSIEAKMMVARMLL
jgi:hypothetical protein